MSHKLITQARIPKHVVCAFDIHNAWFRYRLHQSIHSKTEEVSKGMGNGVTFWSMLRVLDQPFILTY